jgi:hypothetical protein
MLMSKTRQVESYLKKQDGAWFARGDGPTAADFMMLFALEALACGRAGNFNVPYIRKWVRAAHARCVYERIFPCVADVRVHRPAYKAVCSTACPAP